MDIILPDINGVEAYKKIKKISPDTVTVMITGSPIEVSVERTISEGAYACLYKPFGMDEVLNMVRKILN